MSLRRPAVFALVAALALAPVLVAVQSAAAAYVAPFTGVSYKSYDYLDKQLGAMSVGVAYSDSITRAGEPTTWELLGTLPGGLTGATVGNSYVISGTPTAPGDFNFTIGSADSVDNDQISFDVTVVSTPSAQLRGLINVGVGAAHPAPYAPGETFGTWFAFINDSTTVAAVNPTMVITFGPGVSNAGGGQQGSWTCTGTQTVTCTLPPGSTIEPGATNTGYTAYVHLDEAYAKSTFTITNTMSATNSAAAPYTATVQASLPNPAVSVTGPMPYSNVTLTGYAPNAETTGQIRFQLSNGTITENKFADVGADGSATYVGAIDSGFSGTSAVTVSPVWLDDSLTPSAVGNPAYFYAYKQWGVAGHFYLNGALYTDAVKLYVYADIGYPYLAYQRDNLTGGSYSLTPGGGTPYGYYMWAELSGQGGMTTYYNSSNEFMTSVDGRTTVGPHNFTNDMNFYWESAPTFTDGTIAAPRENVTYTDGVEATSNVDVDYLISSGDLPTGLSLDGETGAITGTASVEGEEYSFQIKAGNGYMTSFVDISGTVLPEHILPTWTDDTLGTFRLDTAVADGVAAIGDPTITYEVSEGYLPTGVTIDEATGQLAGAPTVLGEDYEFELHASNSWGGVYADFSGEVLPTAAAPVWTDTTIGELRVGETLTDGVSASAEPAAYYYSLDLPSWVTLNSATGAISATPTVAGPYDFTITAANTEGTVSEHFVGDVEAAWIAPTFTDDEILQLQGGVYLDDQVLATGDGPITYSVPLGQLPFWLTLNPTNGLISGTAPLSAVGQPYSFTVTASGHGTDTVTISGVVRAAPWGGIEPAFVVGDIAAGAEFDFGVSGAGDTVHYSVTVNSTPVIVAQGLTSSLGSASGLGALPLSIQPGAHSIVLATEASDGSPRTTTLWFTVLDNGRIGAISFVGPFTVTAAAAPGLAATGTDVTPALVGALLLLVLGATLRRRRRA